MLSPGDRAVTATLPSAWATARFWVRDSLPDEASELARLYNSCASLGDVDPTFLGASVEEVAGLVDASARAEGGFRMQTIGLRGGGERIGYFHVTHRHPRPETVWVSILVLGGAYQGLGYGREVGRGLLDRTSELPWCEEVWLKVYTANHRALRHWVALGFRRIVEARAPDGSAGGSSLVLARACR
jgi:GNAT superfamily N-acetyltransferase